MMKQRLSISVAGAAIASLSVATRAVPPSRQPVNDISVNAPIRQTDATRGDRVTGAPLGPLETPAYPPAPRDVQVPRRVSASQVWTFGPYASIQVNVDDAGNNVIGDAANEPSIAVDPTRPNRMAIGWRQFDTIANSFRQAGWGYSRNGGRSWTAPGVLEPGIFRSDPVLDFDADGNFYYNSLTIDANEYWCTVFTSTDG